VLPCVGLLSANSQFCVAAFALVRRRISCPDAAQHQCCRVGVYSTLHGVVFAILDPSPPCAVHGVSKTRVTSSLSLARASPDTLRPCGLPVAAPRVAVSHLRRPASPKATPRQPTLLRYDGPKLACQPKLRSSVGWCPWPESNQHSLRNSILSRARLPVPPQGPSGHRLEAAVAKPAEYSGRPAPVNPRGCDCGLPRQDSARGIRRLPGPAYRRTT
jgi:hypothetical protein